MYYKRLKNRQIDKYSVVYTIFECIKRTYPHDYPQKMGMKSFAAIS